MNLFFNLASVARIAEAPIALIDRFEVWDHAVLVVFKKGFHSTDCPSEWGLTQNLFADRVYTAFPFN